MSGKANIQDVYPCTPTQQGILFHCLAKPGQSLYHAQHCISLEGKLDIGSLRVAWERMVERHSILRTCFISQGQETPLQVVRPQVPLTFVVRDLRGVLAHEAPEHRHRLLLEQWTQPLDLTKAPLFRVLLIQWDDERTEHVFTFHHLIADGWAIGLLTGELLTVYEQLCRGLPAQLPPVAPFRDYVAHLQTRDAAKSEAFWRNYLAGFREPLPLDWGNATSEARTPSNGPYAEITLNIPEQMETLAEHARASAVTLSTFLLAAWAIVLARFSGRDDVIVGVGLSGRPEDLPGVDRMVGVLMNSLPVRIKLSWAMPFREWVRSVQEGQTSLLEQQLSPLPKVRSWSELPAGQPLFETMLLFSSYPPPRVSTGGMQGSQLPVKSVVMDISERSNYPLSVYISPKGLVSVSYDPDVVSAPRAQQMADCYHCVLGHIARAPQTRLDELEYLTLDARQLLLKSWNGTEAFIDAPLALPLDFERTARQWPNAPALTGGAVTLTYQQLEQRANSVAAKLLASGVGPNTVVALAMDRHVHLVVALWGILKAGAAYLPLDPAYPKERLRFMLEDAGATIVMADARGRAALPALHLPVLDVDETAVAEVPVGRHLHPQQWAYVIYTSGSSGKPKGVTIQRQAVANFFRAMDDRVPAAGPGQTFCALTSLSFDISVLEILWTLSRGFHVLLEPTLTDTLSNGHSSRPLQFSLFYFGAAVNETNAVSYRLLHEGARFADQHGFEAVWTPERHFHSFGSGYPNPAVLGASLASITQRVKIRAGSIVSPLHHPVRIAEDWSVIDNLSQGRVGVSFASGWHSNDFVLAPDKFADRRAQMLRDMAVVKSLWRGNAVTLPAGDGAPVPVKLHPKPIQSDLPMWMTAAGAPETFRIAGEQGVNLLTHLLGQSIEELEVNIRAYRQARQRAGHDGPGHVTLMVHTLVGEDDASVRQQVRTPFLAYLKASSNLRLTQRRDSPEVDRVEMDALVESVFERHFHHTTLFGSESKCLAMARRFAAAGVNEVGCLIDFGVSEEVALKGLVALNRIREAMEEPAESLVERMARQKVTHVQCTPSLAKVLLDAPEAQTALQGLQVWLLGGEALPLGIARDAASSSSAKIVNMYGPTETTVWSSTHTWNVNTNPGAVVSIGTPVLNTRMYVLDARGDLAPPGAVGELFIGGEGVTQGYLGQPELTAQRFVPDPFTSSPGSRMYKTGDNARWRTDGTLDFLGRGDAQVKIRGHRIELGEIENALSGLHGVASAAVAVADPTQGQHQLVAVIVVSPGRSWSPMEWKATLAQTLPSFMIPTTFHRVEALPLTPNGKLDRMALQRLSLTAAPVAAPEPPATAEEAALLEVFRDVLRRPSMGVVDNFFDMGGDSIAAMQVVARARKRGLVVTAAQVFALPNLRELARVAKPREPSQAQLPVPTAAATSPFSDASLSPEELKRLVKRLR